MTEQPLLLDVRDVQRLCRVGRDAAYELMTKAGAFLGVGRGLRIRPEDLEAHLRQVAEEARE